jgi:hypothetical protein
VRVWVEKSAAVIFLRPIPAITDLIYRGTEFIGCFDIENQIAMDSDLSSQVLKYLEELEDTKNLRKDSPW